jgi:hypothetical protein
LPPLVNEDAVMLVVRGNAGCSDDGIMAASVGILTIAALILS